MAGSGRQLARIGSRVFEASCPFITDREAAEAKERSDATNRRGRAAKRARTRRGKGRRPRSTAEPPTEQAARQGARTARNDCERSEAGPESAPPCPR